MKTLNLPECVRILGIDVSLLLRAFILSLKLFFVNRQEQTLEPVRIVTLLRDNLSLDDTGRSISQHDIVVATAGKCFFS